MVESYIAPDRQSRYSLEAWNNMQRIDLAERIHRKYCEAYNLSCSFDRNLSTFVEGMLAGKINNNDGGLIRSFIKWYVGLLDLKYGPPGGKP